MHARDLNEPAFAEERALLWSLVRKCDALHAATVLTIGGVRQLTAIRLHNWMMAIIVNREISRQ